MLPLATTTWDDQEIMEMHKVIDSGQFTMGERVKEFEKKYALYNESKYCIMVNSGSSANLIGLSALLYRENGNSLKAGDEVIVPAVSWSTTYAPLIQLGLKLKVVDIDIETLNIDINSLEKAISKKTKMIVCVNLLGNPNYFSKIDSLVKGKDIILFEDNCESMGATYNNKKAGTFGLISTTSTFFSHIISTIEGGLILTDDEELYNIMLSLRAHGWTREIPEDNKIIKINSDKFYEKFRFIYPGYNVRPTEIHAAIGSIQLNKIENIVIERRKNAKYFKDLFSNEKFIKIQSEVGESSWLGFSIIIEEGSKIKRKHLINEFDNNGIQSRPIVAGNIVKNEFFKYANYSSFEKLSSADLAHENGLFIGNHGYDIKDSLDIVKNIINNLS